MSEKMTREQAINVMLKYTDTESGFSEVVAKAHRMAIAALSAEPCADPISRQAVNEIINDIRDCISVEGYWAIIERMKKLPPVHAEPRSGHWIDYIKIKCPEMECSECHSRIIAYPYRYCPICGSWNGGHKYETITDS